MLRFELRRLALVLWFALTVAACGAPPALTDSGRGDDSARDDALPDGALRVDANAAADGVGADAAAPDAPTLDASADGGHAPCAAPRIACGAACVDTASNPQHCGACNTPCSAGEACARGACVAPNPCAPLRFPSVTLTTVPDAAMTAAYAPVSTNACFPLPECFIDTDHLQDPVAGRSLDIHVNLSPHFELYELVHTELDGGYSRLVLVSPALIEHLEALRAAAGGPVGIASGFRSPQHQAATCRSICPGGADCCPSAAHPCGCRSRHEMGDAADLAIASSEYQAYAGYARTARFPDCLLEAGSFHVDTAPASCALGCPYNF